MKSKLPSLITAFLLLTIRSFSQLSDSGTGIVQDSTIYNFVLQLVPGQTICGNSQVSISLKYRVIETDFNMPLNYVAIEHSCPAGSPFFNGKPYSVKGRLNTSREFILSGLYSSSEKYPYLIWTSYFPVLKSHGN